MYLSTCYGREMQLELEREVIVGDWIHQLLGSTESLVIRGEGSSKLVPLLPEIPSLKQLEIYRNVKMTRLSDGRSSGTTTVFPLLEFLTLSGIDELEVIHNGPIFSDSFKNLKEITLFSLPKLQHLGNYLLQLKSLSIKSCSMLEQAVLWNKEENRQSSRNHRRIIFPELEKLILRDLPSLASFCNGSQTIEFPVLDEMEIMKCPNLKSLLSSTENDHNKCSGAMKHDDESLHLFCKSEASFGRLKKLKVGGYESSRTEISRLWCDQISVDFFTGLVDLSVHNCDNINNLFSLSIAKNLVNLRELSIKSCREMVKVIEGKVDEVGRSPFINLKVLKLKKLAKLKSLCDWSCAFELPSLEQVSISECPLMERFIFGILSLPISSVSFKNLERVEILSCSMLEQVMLWSEEENGKDNNGQSSRNHHRVTFQNLKELSLEDLPMLTSFCKGIQSIEFPLLTEMKIVKCPNLKSLDSSVDEKRCSGAINHDADDPLHLFCESKAAFERLQYLIIDGYENISSLWCDQTPIDFFTRLVDLTVSNCGNINCLFSLSIVRNLVNLREQSIESCREMVKVIEDKVDEVGRFPFINLKVLKLKKLAKLKCLCDWSCASELPSLKQVSISECPLMEYLPISSVSFKNLKRVKILSCSMLEQVMLWSEEENEKDNNGQSSRNHHRVTFQKLEKLCLHDLSRLTSFCKGIQSIEFPLLTEMKIVKCPNLKSMVSSVDEKRCSGAINHDVDDPLHLFCKSEAAFDKLNSLKIEEYDSISGLWCDLIPIDFFNGLVNLTVENCGNVKSLFSASVAENLVNLIVLNVGSCCEMVKVIEDEEVERSPFIKLKELYLIQLPKLKTFCDWRCALQFPSLEEVCIFECPEMERFSCGSLTTPCLKMISKNRDRISDYTQDLNDALYGGDFLHLDILFGTDH